MDKSILLSDFGLFFDHEDILVNMKDAQCVIELEAISPYLENKSYDHYFLGEFRQKRIHAVGLSREMIKKNDHVHFLPIRHQFETLDPELFRMVCQGKQLLHWHKMSQFCGSCGGATTLSEAEVAKVCSHCQRVIYPCYSPAVMVLITWNEKVLLARSPHFKKGVYSALAGFVSPGETAEQAVEREVFEEVGLILKDIRYFGSQCWPFPDSFMLAYTAKSSCGDLKIDFNELEDARWFTLDTLPILPSSSSISRRLIDHFIAESRNQITQKEKSHTD